MWKLYNNFTENVYQLTVHKSGTGPDTSIIIIVVHLIRSKIVQRIKDQL